MTTDQQLISHTENWLKTLIIKHSICPFAQHEQERGRIRYCVNRGTDLEHSLMQLIEECAYLDSHADTSTTLLIYEPSLRAFDDYLDFLAVAEDLLIDQGYEGIYQLASFHPDYCFDQAAQDDPANYTNRSPYPMLHLLRETSIDYAVEHYPDAENIPQRNIQLTRHLGLAHLRAVLAACYR
ncbi:MAG: DUF1415 domain-containing protein [Methylococcaceae bacterium]|nr:DUF1415 domain-containing protein [Methylococcaceae bacterium]